MKIIMASDHGGINLSKEIASLLEELNIEYVDTGCNCPDSLSRLRYSSSRACSKW